jgi:hypothetical protein
MANGEKNFAPASDPGVGQASLVSSRYERP